MFMKNALWIICLVSITAIADSSAAQTNDLYDEFETLDLEGEPVIHIGGEVADPGTVDLRKLPLRSVVVKEVRWTGNEGEFSGAFRYDGYSLSDVLDLFEINKKNKDEFRRLIDLLVRVENGRGDAAVLSWGEIYYPADRHNIIIATRVSPIFPTKSEDRWPVPVRTKLIVATDLYTERNISDPRYVTVVSAPLSFTVDRDAPLHSPQLELFAGAERLETLGAYPSYLDQVSYPVVFYGRGRGIHGVRSFRGVRLKAILESYFPLSAESIQRGYFVAAAVDGYRCVFSYSEVMNRNDQSEVLVVEGGEDHGGAFKLLPSADFFSDRAVKALSEVHLLAVD